MIIVVNHHRGCESSFQIVKNSTAKLKNLWLKMKVWQKEIENVLCYNIYKDSRRPTNRSALTLVKVSLSLGELSRFAITMSNRSGFPRRS